MFEFIKRMKKKLFVKVCLFSGCLAIVGSSVMMAQEKDEKFLTFDQALQISRQNSHTLKQMDYLQDEKKQEAQATKGYYLPKIGITATYMVMSDPLKLDLNPLVDNAILPAYNILANFSSDAYVKAYSQAAYDKISAYDFTEIIQEDKMGLVAATLNWPLFAGGKIRAANAAANIESKDVEEQRKQKDAELVSEVVERYYGLCLAQQALNVRLDVLKGMQKHLDDALKMEKEGLIANADVLHAKVYNAEAEREVNKAKRTIEILNEALANSLALDSVTKIKAISTLFYLDTIESLEYFKTLAYENSPLLKQVESKKELSRQNYKVQMSRIMPAVAIQGMYNILEKDYSPYAPDWMIGVGLKWNLFDGELGYKKIKAADLKTRQVEEFQEKATSDIYTMVSKLYQELEMYKEQLNELESARQFAEEYVRVREKAFHQDMSNATEVVDARLALAKVSVERLQAMYGYDLTLARLFQYAGIPDQFNNYRTKQGVKTEEYKSFNE
jgi:outer membrane protein TolC